MRPVNISGRMQIQWINSGNQAFGFTTEFACGGLRQVRARAGYESQFPGRSGDRGAVPAVLCRTHRDRALAAGNARARTIGQWGCGPILSEEQARPSTESPNFNELTPILGDTTPNYESRDQAVFQRARSNQ
jgi:hypothetical protein